MIKRHFHTKGNFEKKLQNDFFVSSQSLDIFHEEFCPLRDISSSHAFEFFFRNVISAV